MASNWTVEDLAHLTACAEALYNDTLSSDQLSLYCECCTVVQVDDNGRYCNGCLNDICDDMASRWQEDMSASRGIY